MRFPLLHLWHPRVMPRQVGIDAPGALHHIICRGIERRDIFQDDVDRQTFVDQLGHVLTETSTPCYAWALIPNHFHPLLRTGGMPRATVMRRLWTGYAVIFNRRHRRHGSLFQKRYKSNLCQEDPYLLKLVRYIQLNPVRAKIITTLKELGMNGTAVGRLLGITQSSVSRAGRRGERVALDNRYSLEG